MTGPTTSWSGRRRSFPSRVARRIRDRDGRCMLALPGCSGGADQADHIVSHAEATRLGWSLAQIDAETNGQAVCRSCHRLKTARERAAGRVRARQSRGRPAEKHPGLK